MTIWILSLLLLASLAGLGYRQGAIRVAASLVAGSIVVEVVFSLPGIGRLLVQSVLRGDFPMMQGIVIVTSITFLMLDFVAEQVYRRLFPAPHGR